MIGKYRMRTDLAMENQEKFERDHVEISGVEIEKKKRKAEIQTTIVKITSEQGAKMMGKPKGTYVTIEAPLLLTADEEESRKAAEEFSHCLMEMVPEACGSVLVAGLGNRGITPDALGPETVEQLNVTRHLVRTYGKKGREVSALAPGVMAQTGMETVEIIRGVVEEQSQGTTVSEEDKSFIAEFYKYSFVGVMLDWIRRGMTADPRVLTEKISAAMRGSIANAIRNFSETE